MTSDMGDITKSLSAAWNNLGDAPAPLTFDKLRTEISKAFRASNKRAWPLGNSSFDVGWTKEDEFFAICVNTRRDKEGMSAAIRSTALDGRKYIVMIPCGKSTCLCGTQGGTL